MERVSFQKYLSLYYVASDGIITVWERSHAHVVDCPVDVIWRRLGDPTMVSEIPVRVTYGARVRMFHMADS